MINHQFITQRRKALIGRLKIIPALNSNIDKLTFNFTGQVYKSTYRLHIRFLFLDV